MSKYNDKIKGYLLFSIFHDFQLRLARQQVEDLAPVDLEIAAWDNKVLVSVLVGVQQMEDVPRGQRVDAVATVLTLALELATHGVGLAWSGLTVGEARRHPSFEDAMDEVSRRVLVDKLVGRKFVENAVKPGGTVMS